MKTPARAVLGEAHAAFLARPWRSVVVFLLLTCLIFGSSFLELQTTNRAVVELKRQRLAGSGVLVISGNEPLSGAVCNRLSSAGGFLSAGGVTRPKVTYFDAYPGNPFQTVYASGDYLRIIYPEAPTLDTTGLVAGPSVLDETNMSTGQTVRLSTGEAVAITGSASGVTRATERGRWVTLPTSSQDEVSECWVEIAPGSLPEAKSALIAVFAETEELRIANVVSPELGEAVQDAWHERVSQWLPVAAGLIGFLLQAFLLLARRSEYALYRLVGMARPPLTAMVALEVYFPLTAAAIYSAGLLAFASHLLDADTLALRTAFLALSMSYGIGLSFGSFGWFFSTRGNVSKMLRFRG